jgi:membrane protease YdiL (CAAX protease family)
VIQVTWWLMLGWAAAAAFDVIYVHLRLPVNAYIVTECGWYLAILVFMAQLACREFGATLSHLLPVRRVNARLLAPVLAITAGVFAAQIPVIAFLRGILTQLSADDIGTASDLSLPAQYVAISVFPAIFEEAIFRGVVLQSMLANYMPERRAICFSAFLFATVHFSLVGFPGHFLFGALVGWMFVRTGSLLPGMLMHAANNAIVVWIDHWLASPSMADVSWTEGQLAWFRVGLGAAGVVLTIAGVKGFRRVLSTTVKAPASGMDVTHVFDMAA